MLVILLPRSLRKRRAEELNYYYYYYYYYYYMQDARRALTVFKLCLYGDDINLIVSQHADVGLNNEWLKLMG